MIVAKECFSTMINNPVRKIAARVELFEGSTFLDVFNHTDRLINFSIERVAEEGKFFGSGVCHRLNVHLIDKDRTLNITTKNYLEVEFGTGSEYIYTFPRFLVSEVHRDELTNELSITAYDDLYAATAHTVSELNIFYPYTLEQYTLAIANLLGLPLLIPDDLKDVFALAFDDTQLVNTDGTETLREMLNRIAEITQTFYYIDKDWFLTFRRLDKDGAPIFELTKDKYFELESGDNRRIAAICSATELGENLKAELTITGTTQYIRDNPFWELRTDTAQLVDEALARVAGTTINQFECNWRGNFLLEIGDKLSIQTKDDNYVVSYLLDDVIEYNGALSAKTRWNYVDDSAETESNPTNLGDALKKTFAKVDKVNKEITLLVSDNNGMKEEMAELRLDAESINASVESLSNATEESLSGVDNTIQELSSRVDAAITADNISFAIEKELADGVSIVKTKTGYVFDDEGLTVSKSGSEMKTQITEDGMKVYRDDTAMLTANNKGVEAINLQASTYLIIGKNSRFEDYEENRTACFYIGGEY